MDARDKCGDECTPLLQPETPDTKERRFEIAPNQIQIGEIQDEDKYDYSFSWRKLWAFTGPGFLMSIAYLDPGNIESDLQAGALANYKLLWVLMWSTVMGLILQLLAVRLGCVTGFNLAEVCHREYPKVPRYLLWIMIEIAIIGSDIQEVIGSAIAIKLLSNGKVPLWAGVLLTGADTFTFLFIESAGLRKLEAVFGVLITTMAGTFTYMYFEILPDQGDILKGLWFPWCQDCNKSAITQLVGIVGAVIMPHNIYLHSALVLSRDIKRENPKRIKEANKYNSIESAIALFVSLLINLFVMSVFAEAFSDSKSAKYPPEQATLQLAGTWIGEKYGHAMMIIWGIGILAAGQSSTMTGTYAGQFVMQGFIQIRWAKWKRILLTRSIAIVPTILVAILATKELDLFNSWLNVLQSIQLPFALLPILHFTNSQRIMGHFKNGSFTKFLIWFLALLVMGINLYLTYIFVVGSMPAWGYVIVVLVLLLYLAFVLYLAIGIRRSIQLRIWLGRRYNWDVSHLEVALDEMDQKEYVRFSEMADEVDVQPVA